MNDNPTANGGIPDPPPDLRRPAGFVRRIGAAGYDTLLMIAILLFAHLPIHLVFRTPAIAPEHPWHPAYQLYLFGVCFLYFGWCWMHGQTLGMRAWRIRLEGENGKRVTWRRVWIRFLSAIVSWSVLGMGFLWVLIDDERKSWHDRLSGTVLVFMPRRAKPRR
uniref:Uncharacterized membrane protein YckC, RDD family n=1 Tax=Candidatus Kentrum sp. LFY TaxID=2126342 RepID=A0A450WTB2_9GAMM|nr:MAG: Uncharacterized membrane protein YckC, RDD family [Candidatus Kentron sp. LFY]VFJ98849.1 MAG: Uncharacterized membrane protein YckC, RDD family [Candidatus Kentron sp. LFY]VFK20303.1 MAG: Uncharacterized membrane protein YckC, RDD family [Candidatus Kentron sp. LFY]